MPSLLQQKGSVGEKIAQQYLEQNGYRFVDKQWRCRFGEIDLIMWDKFELVFVEVKLRSSYEYGYPEEMVTWQKQKRLIKTAQCYLTRKKIFDTFWRFDIVAIIIEKNKRYKIRQFIDTIRQDY